MWYAFLFLAFQNLSAEQAMIKRIMGVAFSDGYAVASDVLQDEYDRSPFDWGMEISRSYPRTATTWFKGLYDLKHDEKYRYGIAWCSLLDHDLVGALKAVGSLTTSSDDHMRAQAYSVIGLIAEAHGNFDEATKMSQHALELYQKQGLFADVHTIALRLARIGIMARRFDSARRHLDEASNALRLQSPPASEESVFGTRCLLALATGAYREAVAWAKRAGDDDDQQVASLGRAYLALSLTLLGDLDEASLVAYKAERDDRHPLVRGIVALVWVRIAHCRGLAPEPFLHEYQQWEEKTGDSTLDPLRELVVTTSCDN